MPAKICESSAGIRRHLEQNLLATMNMHKETSEEEGATFSEPHPDQNHRVPSVNPAWFSKDPGAEAIKPLTHQVLG